MSQVAASNSTLVATLLSVLLIACATQATVAAPAGIAAVAGTPTSDCELRLAITGQGDDATTTIHAIDVDGHGGICIKHVGEAITVPHPITFSSHQISRFAKTSRFTIRRDLVMCEDGTVQTAQAPAGTCQWNSLFRDGVPLTFVLSTTTACSECLRSSAPAACTAQCNPAPPTSLPIGQIVNSVRIVRNGDLVYRWDSAAEAKAPSIEIPGRLTRADAVPFLADLDLRIAPAEVVVDNAQLEQKVTTKMVDWQYRLSNATGALLTSVQQLDPSLSLFDCFAYQAKLLQNQIAALVDGKATLLPLPAPPAKCPSPRTLATHASLLAAFSALNGKGKDAVQSLETKATAQLSVDAVQARSIANEILAGLHATTKDWLKAHADKEDAVLQAERLAVSILQDIVATADETKELVGAIRRDVVLLRDDTAQQASLFAAFAAGLSKGDSAFQPWKENPPALPKEAQLHMAYADLFQWYALSPWNAIPIRVTGPNVGGEPSLGNAIPAIDLIGFRLQWGKNRFSSLSGGLGWIYFPDKDTVVTKTEAGDTTSKAVFNTGPEANIRIGAFVIGATRATFVDRASLTRERDRWRVLVGADLFKLVSGKNLEAF